MKPEVLQRLMRHESYQTALGYVNLTNQLDEAIKLMPDPSKKKDCSRWRDSVGAGKRCRRFGRDLVVSSTHHDKAGTDPR